MKNTLLLALLAGASTLGFSSAANAAELFHFQISGGYSAAFDLPASAVPGYFNSTAFTVYNVAGSFTGLNQAGATQPASATLANAINFYTAADGGGIGIDAGNILRFVTSGPMLFSGTTAAPTFLAGTYALAPLYNYGAATLTVSAVAAAVPEPATWMMMILGFGLVGGAMRARTRTTASISIA